MKLLSLRRLSLFAVGIVAALALAACGASLQSKSSMPPATSATRPMAVATSRIAGVGRALVNSSGLPVYVNDQEANGMVLCDGACTAVWRPVQASKAMVASAGIAGLSTVVRADGTTQASLNGKPLYTFYLDSAGKASGNGAADHFGAQSFMWHVAQVSRSGATSATRAVGTPAGSPAMRTAGGMTARY
jgi:predicted lipoprotein with Yx(FWY)xxD motif